MDAGKSTLLGVLTHGELDNGRGFARQKLFRHKHEMESGRTSSVGNDILGFDQEGQVRTTAPRHTCQLPCEVLKMAECVTCRQPAHCLNVPQLDCQYLWNGIVIDFNFLCVCRW